MSRRRWFNRRARASNVTILYRVDTPTESQLWVYEGGQKVQLGTYPVVDHPFNSSTYLTHVGGERDRTLFTSGFFQFNPLTDQVVPYASQASLPSGFGSGGNDDLAYGDSPPVTVSTSGQDPVDSSETASASTTNSLPTSASSTLNGANLNSNQDVVGAASTFFSVPPGDWLHNATLNLTYSPSGATDATASMRTNISGTALFTISDTSGSSTLHSGGAQALSHSWARNRTPALFVQLLAGLDGQSAGSRDSGSLTASGSAALVLDEFRPSAYLAKTTDKRFVATQYLAGDNTIKFDYYELDSSLQSTKTSWNFDQLAQPSSEDLQRSILTNKLDDWIFPTSNPYYAREHYPVDPANPGSLTQSTYNIQPDGSVTAFTSFTNTTTNPGLAALISNSIPEADRILWVAALPAEAAALDPNGHSVTQYALK